MDLVFHPFQAYGPRRAKAGELHVRTRDPKHPRRIALARLALEDPAAFVRGRGQPSRLVVSDDPTLDDMLAAWILAERAAGRAPPAAAAPFALYADSLRRGVRPVPKIPPEESLEGVYEKLRRDAGHSLHNQQGARQFLEGWRRLEAVLRDLMARGVNPHTRKHLFAGYDSLRPDLQLLQMDRTRRYPRDLRQRAERWWVRLPGDAEPSAGLYLREPESHLFKFWARTDPAAPGGGGYRFLAVRHSAGLWFFSVDPNDPCDLRTLADRLQRTEVANDPKRLTQGKDRDPWYNGRRHGHTIVVSPHGGTRLTDAAVLDLVRAWGAVRPVDVPPPPPPPPPRRRWPLVAAVTCSLAVVGFLLLLGGSPPHVFARADVKRDLERWANAPPQASGFVREAGPPPAWTTTLTTLDPGVRHVSCWLQYLSFDRRQPPATPVTLTLPGGRAVALSAGDWVQGETPAVWQTRDRWTVAAGGAPPRFTLAAPGAEAERFQLAFKPLKEMHLHVMAVGVAEYRKETTGFDRLKYSSGDADELMQQFCTAGATLFSEVRTYGPVDPVRQRPGALRDSAATSGKIKDLLREFAAGVRRDTATPLKLAVVIFNGHGTAHTASEFKFIAHDYRPVDQNTRVLGYDIEVELAGLDCPRLLLFDCCNSGLMAQPKGDVVAVSKANLSLAEVATRFAAAQPARFILTACQHDESAYEHTDWKHGALTKAVLDVLAKPAENGRRGVLTLGRLMERAKDIVDDLTTAKGLPQTVVPYFPAGAPDTVPLAYYGDAPAPSGQTRGPGREP